MTTTRKRTRGIFGLPVPLTSQGRDRPAVTTEEVCASPHPGLLDVEMAGRQLQLSRASVWRLIKSGELAHVIHARKAWIPQSEITDYFARRIADATKAARDRRAATKQKARRGTTTRTTRTRTQGETTSHDSSSDLDCT